MSELKPKAFHMDTMEWLKLVDDHTGKVFYDKRMIAADEEGVMINFSKYPAGYYKPPHRHHCSHGIYVIEGKLKTDDGIFGPGSFIWHPEGCLASHGATDEEDCVFLFVSNKPFDIYYEDEND